VKGWEIENRPMPAENKIAIEWFESRFNQALAEVNDLFTKFRISDALLATYKLIWDDFCAWYLEIIKPEYQKPIDRETYERTVRHFENVLKLLHPFMPFISEELWHELSERKEKECVIVASWPVPGKVIPELLSQASLSFNIVGEIRNVRNTKGISPKEPLSLRIKAAEFLLGKPWVAVVQKLSNLSSFDFTTQAVEQAAGFLVGTTECFIPMAGKTDVAKERESVGKEIEYLRGFLASVDKKLSNEKFVAGAPPAVIEAERKKKSDAETKIRSLTENLKNLG
jgi:valyl-tRNA synthetase